MAGLRERKKEHTREAIQREALQLFAGQGYDGTTCEQIAAAAGVSPATLYRYFATKEDIVLRDVYDPLIAGAVRARPADEAPLTAVRRGLADAFAHVYQVELEPIRQRTALILSVPALRARSVEQQQSLVHHLGTALAERGAGDATDLRVQVAASACAAALGVAVEHWARSGGDLPALADAALATLGDLAVNDPAAGAGRRAAR
ncbi:TetR/AcrR family transcriptional regulator [Pengzhenrongella sp.]|jgi:AcrR family transcriptional regulator|uniref:TetR/AcrR family transcriptional regulator n=1 Tax=Pengzhenrongella sp. TaxID=2888820 RepID=UPI002F9451B2